MNTAPHYFFMTCLCTASVFAQELPEGNSGIAARYAADRGIENDPEVFLADDFESYSNRNAMRNTWNSFYNQTRLATETENAYLGNQSIEFRVPQDRSMASEAAAILNDTRKHDVVFLRYYSKFESTYDVTGPVLNGGTISGGYYTNRDSADGRSANTGSKFLVSLAHGRYHGFAERPNPGPLGFFVVRPDSRSSAGEFFRPTGDVLPKGHGNVDFGSAFVSRSDVATELGTWHCHELMLKLNTPGQNDGQIAAWIDGRIVMDFPNLKFRKQESLKVDHIKIGLSIDSKNHPATTKWYDNVVVATSYIGPIAPKK